MGGVDLLETLRHAGKEHRFWEFGDLTSVNTGVKFKHVIAVNQSRKAVI
jgi:hypothetical protein